MMFGITRFVGFSVFNQIADEINYITMKSSILIKSISAQITVQSFTCFINFNLFT